MTKSNAHRVFELLLGLFPPRFQSDFGAEMAAFFESQRREAAGAGGFETTLLWSRTVLDIVTAAFCQHVILLKRQFLHDSGALGASLEGVRLTRITARAAALGLVMFFVLLVGLAARDLGFTRVAPTGMSNRASSAGYTDPTLALMRARYVTENFVQRSLVVISRGGHSGLLRLSFRQSDF
jgi:hypothetical protein